MTRRSIPWFAATLGLLMLFGKMFASGMALYPTDPADPRYSEVVFEHSWRWVKGEVPEGYFELPMGYPVEHMLAHSEPMLSFAPVFWMFRAMTFAPSTSHQLWMFAIALLNFVAFYLLMKHSLRLDSLAASAAGFLFAFGLPRVAQMGHSQLWPQFYIVLVLWGRTRDAFGIGLGPKPTMGCPRRDRRVRTSGLGLSIQRGVSRLCVLGRGTFRLAALELALASARFFERNAAGGDRVHCDRADLSVAALADVPPDCGNHGCLGRGRVTTPSAATWIVALCVEPELVL